jgi:hypothetical protein
MQAGSVGWYVGAQRRGKRWDEEENACEVGERLIGDSKGKRANHASRTRLKNDGWIDDQI